MDNDIMDKEVCERNRRLIRVAAVLVSVKSNKIADRRKFADELSNIYSDNGSVKAINVESSIDFNGPTSWNEIMLTIHGVALSEAERRVGKSGNANSLATCYSELMNKTVQLATDTSDIFLHCHDLMSCIFTVLQNDVYEMHRETYCNIFLNCVLLKKMYRSQISADQWREVLKLSLEMYRGSSVTFKTILLDILGLIVQWGCRQCHLVLQVKQILKFLEKNLQKIDADNREILKPLYRLIYTVCKQISTENRIAVYEFSEKILPTIISGETCSEKIDILFLFVQIYHPGGLDVENDANYPRNLDLWKSIVTEIYNNIPNDIPIVIQMEDQPTNFWELCCRVFRKIFRDPSYLTQISSTAFEEQDEQPRKRRRLLPAPKNLMELLTNNIPDLSEPFIRILTELLKKYPDCLSATDYPMFLKNVSIEFAAASQKNEPTVISLCKLCSVLIELEKTYFYKANQAENIGLLWEKISATVLQSLSQNKSGIFGHKLLQSIIMKKNVLDAKQFFNEYFEEKIRWSHSSIETLLIFSTHNPIPKNFTDFNSRQRTWKFSVRDWLLNWLLRIPEGISSTKIPAVSIAYLLTALSIKFSHTREYREFQNMENRVNEKKIAAVEAFERELFDDSESKILSNIERCHLTMEFRDVIVEFPEKFTNVDSRFSAIIIEKIFDQLITYLSTFLETFVGLKNISTEIMKITVVAKLLSNFLELDEKLESRISKILEIFGEAYKRILEFFLSIEDLKTLHLVQAFDALEIFYSTRYNHKVGEIIVESTCKDFVADIYDFLSEDEEIDEKIHKILTHFCFIKIGGKIAALQERVLKNMMKPHINETTSSVDIERALIILKVFVESEENSKTEETFAIALDFMKNLFEMRRNDGIIIRGILKIFSQFLELSSKFSSTDDDWLLTILSKIYVSIKKKKNGPSVNADFVKCLGKLIHQNPFIKWKIDGANETSHMTEILPLFINDPYYVVRLEVVRVLEMLFSMENLVVKWKSIFFGQVITDIGKLLDIPEEIEACEKADKLCTKTATAIHILVSIIRSSVFLQSRALYAIIELSVEEYVNINLPKRALLSVTKNEHEKRRLLEVNLYDLLTRWLKAENSLSIFPFPLMDCDSQEDFSRKYIDILLTIDLQRLELQEFEILCNNLEISFPRTIEQFFPIVVSLLLSMIVQDSSRGEAKPYALKKWKKLRYNSDEFAPVAKFDILMDEKLPAIVLEFLRRLNDREDLNRKLCIDFFIPKQNSPNFKARLVDDCLEMLKPQLDIEENTLIEFLVARKPNDLQKILLNLFSNVHEAKTTESKILAFYQYRYFYIKIIEKLCLPKCYKMSFYIVSDLSHSLLAFMEDKTLLSSLACTFFQSFISKALPRRANEINSILRSLVSKLVTIVQSGKVKSAIDLLRCLIIDHTEIFAEKIAKLDPFPKDDVFQSVNQVYLRLKYPAGKFYSLEEEIKCFLNENPVEKLDCSYESLLDIENKISTRKNELHEMYDELKKKEGLEENFASNTLHKFIYKLIRVTKSCDTKISLIAAKCLGELGPADLTTFILHTENGHRKEVNDEMEMLIFNVTNLLIDYLIKNDSILRKASSEALNAIFSTEYGEKIAEPITLRILVNFDEMENPNFCEYVYPFAAAKTIKSSRATIIDEKKWEIFVRKSNDLWTSSKYDSYTNWIMEITCRCLDCIIFFCNDYFKPICKLDVKFCEILLPRLLNLAAKNEQSRLNDICLCVNNFFRYAFGCYFNESEDGRQKNVALSYKRVEFMLNIVNFIRIQTNDWLMLAFDYLLIAKAAHYCSAYCTCVYYAELWCEKILRDRKLKSEKSGINLISELEPKRGLLLQTIVREAYEKLGDPDCIYGCGYSHLIKSSEMAQYYRKIEKWDRVTLAHDVALTCGVNSNRHMLQALKETGHQYLVKRLVDETYENGENVSDYMYETAWRLADWSILDDNSSKASENPRNRAEFDYEAAHYRALQALHDQDFVGLENALKNSRTNLVEMLRFTSLDTSEILYPLLSRLQILQEIEKFTKSKKETCEILFNDYHHKNFIERYDFSNIEPILSQRIVILEMQKNSIDNNADVVIPGTLLKIAEIAESQGKNAIAHRALGILTRKTNLSEDVQDQLNYQKALLDWKEEDNYLGRLVLRNLIKKSSLDIKLRAKAFRVYGNWMAMSTCQRLNEIVANYYNVSIETSLKINDIESLAEAQADLAEFADSRYQQMFESTQSTEPDNSCGSSQLDIDPETRKACQKNIDLQKAVEYYKRQKFVEAQEVEEIRTDREEALILAVTNYLSVLVTSNRHDFHVYRLISLWLENKNDDEVNDLVAENFPRIGSHKFVGLLPQLASYISDAGTIFAENITSLMERCAEDHPHHTLPILLAIKNMHKDQEFLSSTTGSQKPLAPQFESQINSATALISKLAKSNIHSILHRTNRFFDALISLVYYKVPQVEIEKFGKTQKIPENHAITKILNFHDTCVPAVNLNVQPTGNYDNLIGISEYNTTFKLIGGASTAKKIDYVDMHGNRRMQLLRSEYNAKPDAALEQIFTMTNSIFRKREETKRRKLRIRTYKVVQLSRESAVIEWNHNHLSIAKILCDSENKSGLHKKYYPNDWSDKMCREKLQKIRRSSCEVKRATFDECCDNFRPAFQYYFIEKYPSIDVWFEKRLAYVRSIATNSMIGFLLSLGGRKPENILVDDITAEVIHIDHEIFIGEREKILTSEKVPFRLTRNIEAAMGICGVEGLMKRSCEKILNALRDERIMVKSLLTILLYEPLFIYHQPDCSGRLSQIQTEDKESTEARDEITESNLMKIARKLDGIEDGQTITASSQVERLINESRDPDNLCLMHYDWQPYL